MSMKLEAILQLDSNNHSCSLPKPRDKRLPLPLGISIGKAQNGDESDDKRFESELKKLVPEEAEKILAQLNQN